jgi:hypothetical protein
MVRSEDFSPSMMGTKVASELYAQQGGFINIVSYRQFLFANPPLQNLTSYNTVSDAPYRGYRGVYENFY